jgi:AcrR family transcriptional regulator
MPGSRDRIGTFYQRFLRKTPQQPRSRSVVDGLLVAALDRLARADADDPLTLNEVAKKAGVAIGSLYDYFPDRTSLLSAAATKVAATLANGQALFAEALTKSLTARSDVHVTDPEHASWVVTQAVMGTVGTLIWDDAPPEHVRVREALITMVETFLTCSVAPRQVGVVAE